MLGAGLARLRAQVAELEGSVAIARSRVRQRVGGGGGVRELSELTDTPESSQCRRQHACSRFDVKTCPKSPRARAR